MLRRTLLQLAAAAGLATRLTPAKAAQPLRVVVVGAGPAGFSAALELAERGVSVLLLEAGAQVGGKVKGWTEPLEGVEQDVEHGVHGWWHQYVHWDDLLRRHGLLDRLNLPDSKGTFRWPGGEYNTTNGKGFRQFVRLFKERSRELGYKHFGIELHQGQRWLRSLTVADARAQLGGQSVEAWHKAGAPLSLWRVFDAVTSPSMFFAPTNAVDASEYALAETFYHTGTKHNIDVRWLKGNPQELLWAPLSERLIALGGELRTNAEVYELEIRKGAVLGVRVGQPLPGAQLTDLSEGWNRVDRDNGLPIYILKEGPHLSALSGRCTHAGCPVDLSEDGFVCPCHGGRFDFAGRVIDGPPKQPLAPLYVEEGADGVTVEGEGSPEFIPADAVILALDGPALGRVAGEVLPAARKLRPREVAVARFWLDRDLPAELGRAAMLEGADHANNAFLLHRMQDRARDWAAEHHGAVIELQASRDLPADREQTLDRLEADLRKIYPELAEAKVLKRTLSHSNTFTAMEPGFFAGSLPVESGVPNLYLAGDHVRLDRNCHFMEKAVTTGRMAANAVLRRAGLPEAPILPERR